MLTIKKNDKCRICNSRKLKKFLSLDSTPLANSFVKKKDFRKEKKYPLALHFCTNCFLVQLTHVVNKKNLFSHYVYFYSVMPHASSHFTNYAKDVKKKFITDLKNDLILEFGSNDGVLLKAFQEIGCKRVLGIDPAKNIAKVANRNNIPTIPDFFSYDLSKKIVKKNGKAKVIIANNTLAHIDDLHDVMNAVLYLLDTKGVFVFEVPYLMDMFENLAYDSIYHEHLSYIAITPLSYLFKLYGLEIFDVELVKRQGNSIRVFVSRSKDYSINPRVTYLLSKEKKNKFHQLQTYIQLAKRIKRAKEKLYSLLVNLKKRKFVIAAYGAPARGNTVLNYANITQDILDYATEELQSKIGFYTPGMHIPVIDIKKARKRYPDYFLLLAWDYKEAIMNKEKKFLQRGGKFITPVGKVGIIRNG